MVPKGCDLPLGQGFSHSRFKLKAWLIDLLRTHLQLCLESSRAIFPGTRHFSRLREKIATVAEAPADRQKADFPSLVGPAC